jgi:pimeloyl-ACP methyl ester carboxylesterase
MRVFGYVIFLAISASSFFLNACQSGGSSPASAGGSKIDTSFYVALGGVRQHIEVWGEDRSNPVLLFLHGGPGLSAIPYLRYFNPALAKSFTIASYDQRGAWVSVNVNENPGNMTLEQHVKDAYELTQILKERLGNVKICVAGHDWGSVIGVNLVQQHPEAYAAYCGLGQVVDFRASERSTTAYLQELAINRADGDAIRTLRSILKDDSTSLYVGRHRGMLLQRAIVRRYRGIEHEPNLLSLATGDSLGLYNPVALAVSQQNTLEKLYPDLLNVNFTQTTEFKVPVFIFSGEHDLVSPHDRTKAWFESVKAPAKKFFIFEKSAHSPQWEEPAYFIDNMNRVVKPAL